MRNNYKLPFTLKQIEDNGKQIFFIKLSQNVTFLNKGKVQSALLSIPDGAEVMIDGGRSTFIDKDVLEIISDFKESAEYKNIKVITEEIPEVATLSKH